MNRKNQWFSVSWISDFGGGTVFNDDKKEEGQSRYEIVWMKEFQNYGVSVTVANAVAPKGYLRKESTWEWIMSTIVCCRSSGKILEQIQLEIWGKKDMEKYEIQRILLDWLKVSFISSLSI